MKKYTFHVSGTHCSSCKIFVEQTLKEDGLVSYANLNLKTETLEVEIENNTNIEDVIHLINNKINSNGYFVSVEKQQTEKIKNGVIWKALPIGVGILVLFFLLQKSGLLDIGVGGQITPVTSFLIGVLASVSSCLAVVGGLVLSLSAKISQDKISDTKTFTLFHISRLVSFAILGGLLGILGNAIGINFTFTAILGIIASLIMLLLGLNLVGVIKQNKITFSSKFFNYFKGIEHKTFAPVVLGFATFLLPCGFTQSMQFSALSSGSFVSGMMIMFSFALGTLPMLALLSFGSASFSQGKYSSLFFKSAGVVVVGLGIFSLLGGLAGLGIINPLFNI